jgi:lipopolysaccharide biosynthesis regulator YciM
MGEYGRAEAILKKLLDVEDSKEFALNELAVIQRRKRE